MTDAPVTPKKCDLCEEWNQPVAPFRIFGNTYYVGTYGLSAVLIGSDKGLILLDGALPQSGSLIEANIRTLGFRPDDIKVIANSHAHFDHAGGIAQLQRRSGSKVLASPWGAECLRRGDTDANDPQQAFGHELTSFPPVEHVETVRDGEVVAVGDLKITAHFTPGHTPGGTTWTWRSCEGSRCVDVVYADSLAPFSAPGFRFSGDARRPSVVESFRRSIATMATLQCDIFIAVHPDVSGVQEKFRLRAKDPETDPFINPQACRSFAEETTKRLDKRLAEEQEPTGTISTAAKETHVLQRIPVLGTNYQVGLGMAQMDPNTIKERHMHSGPEVGYVLEGEIALLVQGQPAQTIKAGESFQTQAGVSHVTKAGPNGAKILASWVVEQGKSFALPDH